MKKQKSIGNKGFSLVELIIVIAIMAILIGVMAPQLMKYVERSKQSKDIQAVDAVHTAVVTAMLDPAVDKTPSTGYASLSALMSDTTNTNFVKAVTDILGTTTATDIEGKGFTSKAYANQVIKIDITGNKVTCTVTKNGDDTTGATDIVID